MWDSAAAIAANALESSCLIIFYFYSSKGGMVDGQVGKAREKALTEYGAGPKLEASEHAANEDEFTTDAIETDEEVSEAERILTAGQEYAFKVECRMERHFEEMDRELAKQHTPLGVLRRFRSVVWMDRQGYGLDREDLFGGCDWAIGWDFYDSITVDIYHQFQVIFGEDANLRYIIFDYLRGLQEEVEDEQREQRELVKKDVEDPKDAHRASPLGNVENEWNCRSGQQHMVLLM